MAERPTYKLRFLDPKKRFPAMPEQPAGRSYGVVWKLFGEDQHESCYVVEFVGKSHVSLLGYVSVSGEVYKVDRPVSETPLPNDPDMELVLDESDSGIGEIVVRGANGTMRACARTVGSPEGPMREQSDHETWNSTRSLPYGEFMASMFLRYVIFADSENAIASTADADGLDEGMQNVVDKIKLVKLPEPVEVFLGFNTTPLPDAIETLLYRVDHAENPSGIERYAAALMSEIDLPRLRTIAAKSEMSLARIDRSKLFYLNFDRSLLDQDEIDMLLAIECRLNRLSGILEHIGAGLVPAASSPSLEGCALFDAWHIAKTTNDVPRLLDTASSDNPWGKPGTVACQPGGEWDVRTRFARIVEALNVITRLDYTYRANVAEGIMLVRFGHSVVDAMPQREYDAQDDAWRELEEDTRAIWAAEHDARVALTLAAACFAAGTCITRCYVQIAAPDSEQGERVVATYFFGRAAYLADCVPVAKDLESMDMDDMPCKRVLEAYESTVPETIEPAEVHARPRDDHRTLPPALRDLLLADKADELEVMEEDDDPYVARVVELREQAKVDRTGAFEGFPVLSRSWRLSAPSPSFWRQVRFKRSFVITSWYAWCYRCWKKTALCESFVRPMRCTLPSTRSAAFTPSKRTLNEHCPRCAIFTIWRARPCNRTLRSSTCLRAWSALTRLSRWRATAYVLPAIVLQSATCSIAWRLPIGIAISSSSRWRATASCRAARSQVATRWRKCRAL